MKIKEVVKYLFFGISWGCTFFVLIYFGGYLAVGESFIEPLVKDFARQALGAMAIGIGFGSSSIIYKVEKLSIGIQTLIHFFTGIGIFILVAVPLGWLPIKTPVGIFVSVIIEIVSFMIIWSLFYAYNRSEVKKVNKKLKEWKEENKETGTS